MKLILSTLILFVIIFNCNAFEQYQIRKSSTATVTPFVAYADISKYNQASFQFNWTGAATATATFYVSNDFSKGPSSATSWISLDTLAMSNGSTASYTKAFTSLPYKSMKISIATSATPTTVGIDMIGK